MSGKKEEIIKKLKNGSYVHFILRDISDKDREPIYVEYLNSLNCFYKPGFEFRSMTLEEEKIKLFLKFIDEGKVEAFCVV